MNAEETAKLCALVANVCPQQQMIPADPTQNEPGTAAFWWPLLQDLRYPDAVLAVQRLAKRQRFIAQSEIIAEVEAIRGERLAALPEAQRPVPNVDPNDVRRYLAGKRAIQLAIADGDIRSDGAGGYVLPSARWQSAIAAGPTTEPRQIDVSSLFKEVPRHSAQERAEREARAAEREVERRERERQLAVLEEMQAAYERARAARRAKKKPSRRKAKPLTVSGSTLDEPQPVRDTAAS